MTFENALSIHPQMAQLRTAQIAVQSGNLFNSETPNYRSRVFKIDFDQPLAQLATTNDRHISNNSTPKASVALRNSGKNMSAEGNDVSLAQEQAELAQSVARFNISLFMVREQISRLEKVTTRHS